MVRPREAWLPVEDDPLEAVRPALERDVERERPDDRLLPLFAREVVAAILITSIWVFPRPEKTLAVQYPSRRGATPACLGWGVCAHADHWCHRVRGRRDAWV